jgi:hypothetical protein
MNSYGHGFEPRFKLDEAKFFFQQMERSLQNPKENESVRKFLFYLDAFLDATRNITFVFQKEFKNNKKLTEWYGKKVQGWQNDKIMKFFIEMRNISLKEHTPETLTLSTSKVKLDTSNAVIEYTPEGDIQIKIPFVGSTEETQKPNQLRSSAAYFYRVPNWFDENPDVIYLCKRYLDELEEFVTEAENMIKKE